MRLIDVETKEPIHHYNSKTPVEIPEHYREKPFRAVWVSNVLNIDMPTTENESAYRKKVMEIFDTCGSYNLNALIFQVRPANDAFYESDLNPISRYLTGEEGNKPSFDVMAWIIEEAHKRNIEFHAWCNPYRISAVKVDSVDEYLATCDDMNFAKRHPEYVIKDNYGKLMLNPALSEVKGFIIDSMKEIVSRYDVDGIHFDDYFYPYGGMPENTPGEECFDEQDQKAVDDFRRKNVNDIIKGVNDGIKEVRPSVRFGISPFGIWRNKQEGVYGSNTAPSCSESYHSLYADSVRWVKEGWIDYVVPQIYWNFAHSIAPFADICDFWVDVCENEPVDLYIGHGAYRLGEKGFKDKNEIVNQIKYANQYPGVDGNVFFTYHTFVDDVKWKAGMRKVKALLNGVEE